MTLLPGVTDSVAENLLRRRNGGRNRAGARGDRAALSVRGGATRRDPRRLAARCWQTRSIRTFAINRPLNHLPRSAADGRHSRGDPAHRRRRCNAGSHQQGAPAVARPGRDARHSALFSGRGARADRRRAGDAGADLVRALRPQDLQGADRLTTRLDARRRDDSRLGRAWIDSLLQDLHPRRDRGRRQALGALGVRGQRRHHRLRRPLSTSPSRSRRTTTPRRSSPSAARTPASAA